jgi:hypothetical protein
MRQMYRWVIIIIVRFCVLYARLSGQARGPFGCARGLFGRMVGPFGCARGLSGRMVGPFDDVFGLYNVVSRQYELVI